MEQQILKRVGVHDLALVAPIFETEEHHKQVDKHTNVGEPVVPVVHAHRVHRVVVLAMSVRVRNPVALVLVRLQVVGSLSFLLS